MNFVKINPGTFLMGSPESELGRDSDETQHQVILTSGFEMQDAPVTQAEWREFMGTDPSRFKGNFRPVENVSWHDVQAFIFLLNAKEKEFVYRLPTEAEWEYCCRAGTTSRFSCASSRLSWCATYGAEETAPVRSGLPNPWRLYDMHGNVWEWCSDWYGEYPTSSATNPQGPSSGSSRVFRGGGWDDNGAGDLRSARRGGDLPSYRVSDLGFRLLRTPITLGPLTLDPLSSESAKRDEARKLLRQMRAKLSKLEKLL